MSNFEMTSFKLDPIGGGSLWSRKDVEAQLPDLTDPRYLDEVGWFLYHEKYERDSFGDSYDAERLAYSDSC